MCLGIPARLVDGDAGHPDLAIAEVGGVPRSVNLGLLERRPSRDLQRPHHVAQCEALGHIFGIDGRENRLREVFGFGNIEPQPGDKGL